MPDFSLRFARHTLALKHTFTISRSSRTHVENVFLTLTGDGYAGYGEAAPNTRYGESAASVLAYLDALPDGFFDGIEEPQDLSAALDRHSSLHPVASARVAVEMAWLDWRARSRVRSLGHEWSPGRTHTPPTSFTIGIGNREEIVHKVREAERAPLLKVKLGTGRDEEIIRTIRDLTDKPLRVDANEGWDDLELARRRIDFLAGWNVEMVEQPMPAGMRDELEKLKAYSPIPLCADESFRGGESLEQVSRAFDIINIKLMKIGSLLRTREVIRDAREKGLRVMIGCMVESSLAISAGAAVALEADHADLDGFLLIEGDPFGGLHLEEDYRITTGNAPGLGVEPVKGDPSSPDF